MFDFTFLIGVFILTSKNLKAKISKLTQKERREFEAHKELIDTGLILESALVYLKTHTFINKNILALYIIKYKLKLPISMTLTLFEEVLRLEVARVLSLIKKAGGIIKWTGSSFKRVEGAIYDLTPNKIMAINTKND